MPVQHWNHSCQVLNGTIWMESSHCDRCGEEGQYDGWYLTAHERIARHQYIYGLKQFGSHTAMVANTLKSLRNTCEQCSGRGILTDPVEDRWSVCPACGGTGGHWIVSKAKIEVARRRVLDAYPNAEAPRLAPEYFLGDVALVYDRERGEIVNSR